MTKARTKVARTDLSQHEFAAGGGALTSRALRRGLKKIGRKYGLHTDADLALVFAYAEEAARRNGAIAIEDSFHVGARRLLRERQP